MDRKANQNTFLIILVLSLLMFCINSSSMAQEPFMVTDICPGAVGSDLEWLTNVNSTLFFRADDGTHGQELWKSDGTEAGTVLVADIQLGAVPSNPEELTDVNGMLFFQADDGINGQELWKSDGTEAGTMMVKDINPSGSSGPGELTNVNSTLFFRANDGTNGWELWKSDGTEAGTMMVKDINPSGNSYPEELTNVNGTLFFLADEGTNGRELWKSDGTEVGTVMVYDIKPGTLPSGISFMTNVNGTLFFEADDGMHGSELWKSDGTSIGTVMVLDINPGVGHSWPIDLTNVNGILFFGADDWVHGWELWKSNGTETGTMMVKDINPITFPAGHSSPSKLTNVNGTLFFSADDGTHGPELWKSDGTEAGTLMVKDINPGIPGSDPSELKNFNGILFFSAVDGTYYGRELWKSDGTEAGTAMVADINPSAGSSPSRLTNVKHTLFFGADDGTHGGELWAYYAETIFVDVAASGDNNGTSWANAYLCLQDALNHAVSGNEIFVAHGTYKPDQGVGLTPGDRKATFQLINGVAIYGGFPPGGGTWEQRDPSAYETILSGDLNGDDVGFTNNAENSYHVVTGSNTGPNTILDGFTITAGNANGIRPYYCGGGMYNDTGSPTVRNCTFTGNWGYYGGGGMYNIDSSPILTKCVFIENSGYYGGGMLNDFDCMPIIINCEFLGNSAVDGGGIYNDTGIFGQDGLLLTNCTFSGNLAQRQGGGICNIWSSLKLTNCTLSANRASINGGGIYIMQSDPTVTNCILWGNTDSGPADESSQIFDIDGTTTIKYSCVQGWTGAMGGEGNIGDDPLFKDADGPDDIPGTEDDNLELTAHSPCIDAGDNGAVPADTVDLDGDGNTSERIPLDLAGNARFTDDKLTVDTGVPATGYPEIVEMGAYERVVCGGPSRPYPPGDVNQDCEVNFFDIAIIANNWLSRS